LTESNPNLEIEKNNAQIKSEAETELQNDRKRKNMDPSVFEAFRHPSFKSKTIRLSGKKEGAGATLKNQNRTVEHKFQFL
jgi:hypothetical protein